jgi:hypothetical protein
MIDCLVRNMSRNGAKLVFKARCFCLPGEFELMLPQKGESRRARIVWRQQDEAGIAFLQAGGDGVVSIGMGAADQAARNGPRRAAGTRR